MSCPGRNVRIEISPAVFDYRQVLFLPGCYKRPDMDCTNTAVVAVIYPFAMVEIAVLGRTLGTAVTDEHYILAVICNIMAAWTCTEGAGAESGRERPDLARPGTVGMRTVNLIHRPVIGNTFIKGSYTVRRTAETAFIYAPITAADQGLICTQIYLVRNRVIARRPTQGNT